MKSVFYFITLFITSVGFLLSCSKQPIDRLPDNDEGLNDVYDEILLARSTGGVLPFDIDVTGKWEVSTADTASWVTVMPSSGEGPAVVEFSVDINYTEIERSVVYSVYENAVEVCRILIKQPELVIPIHDGDFKFLKWLVDNKAYGDATPEVDWYLFDGTGFPAINFDVDASGKYFIKDIDMRADASSADMMFNSFPPEISLKYITTIYVNYTAMGMDMDEVNCPLMGSEFPSLWDCPMLERVHLECVGMVGVIPQSFADLPNLRALFVRSCDLYGALPQKWASDKFESVVIGFNGSRDCPNLGYMVPAQLDIILNSQKPQDDFHADRNEYKLGGYPENWYGFEVGWGQTRYEKFDPDASKGNVAEWSSYRVISKGTQDEIAPGGIRNPLGTSDVKYIDSWETYYTNVNYRIPAEMLKWNQADADAYTAEAAKRERLYVR